MRARTELTPSELRYMPQATSLAVSSSSTHRSANVGRSLDSEDRHAVMERTYVSGAHAGSAGKSGCRAYCFLPSASSLRTAKARS